jgi:hypothetical protein
MPSFSAVLLPRSASAEELRTSSEKGEHKGDESLTRVQTTTDLESY